MKTRPKINSVLLLVLIVGFVIPSSLVVANKLYIQAFEEEANSAKSLDLGKPFVVENYQSPGGKPVSSDEGIYSNFAGEGILNDTINIAVEGNYSEILRNNDTSYIQGTTKFSTKDNGTALFDFHAIGNYKPDGTFNSNGAAIFEDEANGELSFLSNWVAIYKDQVDKSGNGTFLMWHLK
jgi:hypothetical protein